MINKLSAESSQNQASTVLAEKPALMQDAGRSEAVLPTPKTLNEPLTYLARPVITKPKSQEKIMPPKPIEKAAPAENRAAEREKTNAARQRELEAAISSITK